MSQPAPWGRSRPRWSCAVESAQSALSIASLPDCGTSVSVDPPLGPSGPRLTAVLFWMSPAALKEQEPSSLRFEPWRDQGDDHAAVWASGGVVPSDDGSGQRGARAARDDPAAGRGDADQVEANPVAEDEDAGAALRVERHHPAAVNLRVGRDQLLVRDDDRQIGGMTVEGHQPAARQPGLQFRLVTAAARTVPDHAFPTFQFAPPAVYCTGQRPHTSGFRGPSHLR